MLNDKRRCPRFEIPLCVEFKPSKEREEYALGITSNFSRKGLCFKSNKFNLKKDEPLDFKLQLPHEDRFIPVSGNVMWKEKVDDKFLVGIKLREMHSEDKCDILEYCYTSWVNKIQSKNKSAYG